MTPSFSFYHNGLRDLVSRVSRNSDLAAYMHTHACVHALGRVGAYMCRGVFSRHSRHFLERSYMQQGLDGCRLSFFRRHSGDTFRVQATLLWA